MDELTIVGGRPLRGRLRVPGDKSISHRALLFAALATGRSRIDHLADGDDVARTLGVIEALGAETTREEDGAVRVDGPGREGLREPGDVLDCGNSGTTMRLAAGLLAGCPFHAVLTGDASLRGRPMGRVVEPLRAMGARVDGRHGARLPPLSVRGGDLVGATHRLEVPSAQVVSALVLAGLAAEGPTVVHQPHPSRDHTERMLAELGAPVERLDATTVAVTRGRPEPFDLAVPGDPSSAAFFVVAATLVPGSELLLEDVALNPTRLGFVDVLVRMGASIEVREQGERGGEPVGDLVVRSAELRGTVVDGAEIPRVIDELPVLAVAAARAQGATTIRDAAELRIKESDRVATIAETLGALGADVEVRDDGFIVQGAPSLRRGVLASHGDHRVAMAAATAAAVAEGESTVRGWSVVGTSYPGFARDLEGLRT